MFAATRSLRLLLPLIATCCLLTLSSCGGVRSTKSTGPLVIRCPESVMEPSAPLPYPRSNDAQQIVVEDDPIFLAAVKELQEKQKLQLECWRKLEREGVVRRVGEG